MITLVILALVLFIGYNVATLATFHFTPWSLSETYYLYNRIKPHLGWLFTAFMWLMAGLLIPSWITIADALPNWSHNVTFLSFISTGSMLFIGAAPQYKDETSVVHIVAAITCAVSALLWNLLVAWNVYYIPFVAAIIPIIWATVTHTWKSSREYWLEMIAFDITFATVLTEAVITNV